MLPEAQRSSGGTAGAAAHSPQTLPFLGFGLSSKAHGRNTHFVRNTEQGKL